MPISKSSIFKTQPEQCSGLKTAAPPQYTSTCSGALIINLAKACMWAATVLNHGNCLAISVISGWFCCHSSRVWCAHPAKTAVLAGSPRLQVLVVDDLYMQDTYLYPSPLAQVGGMVGHLLKQCLQPTHVRLVHLSQRWHRQYDSVK